MNKTFGTFTIVATKKKTKQENNIQTPLVDGLPCKGLFMSIDH